MRRILSLGKNEEFPEPGIERYGLLEEIMQFAESPGFFVSRVSRLGLGALAHPFATSISKRREVKALAKHLEGHDAFCVQESRGSWVHPVKHCRFILRDFWVRTSFGDGNGVIIILVSRNSCPSQGVIGETALCVRRAQRVCIQGDDCQLVIHNIHNPQVQNVINISSIMDSDILPARANPRT